MRRIRMKLCPIFVFPLALGIATSMEAKSHRVFLSASGNDSADCANATTPCLTFAGALAQVTAGGEVLVRDTGAYGTLNISQSVTINAPLGVVAYTRNPVTVNAPGAVVVLRGLTVDGASGDGINTISVGALLVDNCVINGSDTGISVSHAGLVSIKDTVIRNGTGSGIGVAGTGNTVVSIDHCRVEDCLSCGIVVKAAKAVIRDTVVMSCLQGFCFPGGLNGPVETTLDNCLAADNDQGIECSGTQAVARVSNSTIIDNGSVGLSALSGGTIKTRGNNTVEGNGMDINGNVVPYSAK